MLKFVPGPQGAILRRVEREMLGIPSRAVLYALLLGFAAMCTLLSVWAWFNDEHVGQTIVGETTSGFVAGLLTIFAAYWMLKFWYYRRHRKLDRLVAHWWDGIMLNLRWVQYDQEWFDAWNLWQQRLSVLATRIDKNLNTLLQIDSRAIYDKTTEPDRNEIAKKSLTEKLAELKKYLMDNLEL